MQAGCLPRAPAFAEATADMSRPLRLQSRVSPAGDRNATQKARARTFVEIHETGHAFELEHDLTENSVMWAPDSNADEPKFQTVPIVFKAADIAVIRETENP